jgi:hypothetical protein
MKIMISIVISLWVICCDAQIYWTKPPDKFKIYNVDQLLNLAKTSGFDKLKEITNPLYLYYVDSASKDKLIDLEFASGLWGRNVENRKITYYNIPEIAVEFAKIYNDKKAAKKLLDYYCALPKYIKSDTIYTIYNDLDDYLSVLVKYKSPMLVERLKRDYYDWKILAGKAPKKKYPTKEELYQKSISEILKFNPSELYVDCNYILLQIAGALNYLKIKEFDLSLMENLKKKQSNPYYFNYSFPTPYRADSRNNDVPSKTIKNTYAIKNFKGDLKKIEKIICDSFGDGCQSESMEIIEKGSVACILISRRTGYTLYLVCLKSNNTIEIKLVEFTLD